MINTLPFNLIASKTNQIFGKNWKHDYSRYCEITPPETSPRKTNKVKHRVLHDTISEFGSQTLNILIKCALINYT